MKKSGVVQLLKDTRQQKTHKFLLGYVFQLATAYVRRETDEDMVRYQQVA